MMNMERRYQIMKISSLKMLKSFANIQESIHKYSKAT